MQLEKLQYPGTMLLDLLGALVGKAANPVGLFMDFDVDWLNPQEWR